ncbi:5,6-dimethylbenzimidazole synthase [Metallosphaera hakonensis]|uniref:5,6-dimethylbenzimidazole synthase n=1 Tax=Metallosphaera hakonensis JCM 8857 = DSM 7519 TaxID=1293036 RepID=A0A2U9IWJ4_9CREN|nr:5,6-dimethylbenzimidazole synthase [Metallosphaera hakonensis]
MDLYEAIKRRRDIRSTFKSNPIPDDVLARILMAGHLAPSVGFSQPWNFIVIRDIDVRKKILEEVLRQREEFAKRLDEDRRKIFEKIKIEGILDTPLNIAVTCDPSRFGPNVLGRHTMPETCEYSSVLAVGNMWLAARAEGIGMGWVSFMEKETVKTILKIPHDVKLIAYLCLGYVTHFPEVPELEEKGWNSRLPISELVFLNQWGSKVEEKFKKVLDSTKL